MTVKGKTNMSFSSFREQELKKYKCPVVDESADWQQRRAVALRQGFIEYQIKAKWKQLHE